MSVKRGREGVDDGTVFASIRRPVLRWSGPTLSVLLALGLGAWLLPPSSLIVSRIDCGESAAIATLKNLHWAQQEFAARAAVDCDGDGHGEYGTFAELNGTADLRHPTGSDRPPHRLVPPVLGTWAATAQAGRVTSSGYCFQVWLTAGDGRWRGDGTGGDAVTRRWCAYAWPAGEGRSRRVFFVDDQGDVYASANGDRRYGADQAVPVDAALPSADANAAQSPGVRTGRDGRPWSQVN